MGHQLKSFDLGNGQIVQERACMDYVCRYCGVKASASNMVANLCLQVFARHQGRCGAYVESDQYTGYVSECSTCRYYENDECTHGEL